MLRRGQAVLDIEVGAKLIELVPVCGFAFAQTEQAVSEFLPVVGQNGADAQRASPFQVAQKSSRIGGGLGFEDPDEHPAGCTIDGHEQVRDAETDPGSREATGGEVSFLRARMDNEVLKAQTAKVRLKKMRAEVIDRARATEMMFDLARRERDA